jgi:hypothetical protein
VIISTTGGTELVDQLQAECPAIEGERFAEPAGSLVPPVHGR